MQLSDYNLTQDEIDTLIELYNSNTGDLEEHQNTTTSLIEKHLLYK